ncbi:MAG: DUF2809 domain-containing protein [Janthinobacterium lividum]
MRDAARRQLCAAAVVVACGLAWRLVPMGLPHAWVKYGGSALWGAMVLLVVAGVRRRLGFAWSTPLAAGVVAVGTELLRLVHAPALDAFRATLPGALLLGRVFSLRDLAAYAAGIAVALPVYAATLSRAGSKQGRALPGPAKGPRTL